MPLPRVNRCLRVGVALACLAASWRAHASEYHGSIVFGELPVSGATVTATQGDKKISVVSDANGGYSFPNLADGAWTIEVEMLCFAPLKEQVTIAASVPAAKLELKLLPLDQIMAKATAPPPPVPKPVAPVVTASAAAPADAKPAAKAEAPPQEAPRPPENAASSQNDGLLINGSSTNAATSQFTLAPAFGNSRSAKSLYNGSLAVVLDNSALDAKQYSITGLQVPKPAYNDVTAGVTFGGPINIPRLMPHGPNFFIQYQTVRNRTDLSLSGLVPTLAQNSGYCVGSTLPATTVQEALLDYYPCPNLVGSNNYNYQTSARSNTHQDSVSMRLDKRVTRKDSVWGNFAMQSTRSDAQSLFHFDDTTDLLGMNATANWSRNIGHQIYNTAGYRFSRLRIHVIPEFQDRVNVSGNAGITAAINPLPPGSKQTPGNLQDAADWGPPTLVFSSGIASLTDAQSARNRNETNAVSDSVVYSHRKHNYTAGVDFRRQEFNVLAQQNPRGTYTFTGTAGGATGTDIGDFLAGTPDTSQIAYGNADKYLRQSVYDVYVNDDWRLRPELTLSVGMRWDYGAPVTELKGRLVNLQTGTNFASVTPVLGSAPGSLPTSLVRPDLRGFELRLGLSWRPVPADSLVIRSGYGVYDDTSVYQSIAGLMDQQAPLSTSVNDNTATCSSPLTLANGFPGPPQCSATTPYSFGVDPNFRVGYAQIWFLSAQRDLPGALVANVTYTGTKGTRGTQEFLPNSYPLGGTPPCVGCASGYAYRTANGNSTRESVQAQLRRRLRSGFTATLLYTYSKSIDDDATLGGQGPVAAGAAAQAQPNVQIAQNWLNLNGERGLSTFDQRHLVNAQVQYTSGMGKGGGSLMTGWRGTLLKEWTLVSVIAAGTGLPETPIYYATTPGTSIAGIIRPSLTGAPIYSGAAAGHHLNIAAYTAPAAGQWGNARRDSITGPGQFTLTGSLQRTFRLKGDLNLDFRVDATNLLNHVVYSAWNTIIPESSAGSTTFGLPASANAMRSLQTTIRLRY